MLERIQQLLQFLISAVRYDTSPDQSYCKRFLKKGICLHILFLREYHDLPAFDTSLFLRFRYLKNLASYDVDKEHPAGEGVSPANEPEDAELYDGDGESEKVSKPQDRYFEVVEVTKQICDIAPKYAPKQFKVVLETLKEFEKLIRTNGIDDNVLKFLKSHNSYNLILKASQTEDTQDSFEVPTNTDYQQSHNTGTQSGNSNNPDMQDTETHTTRTNNQDTHTTNAENQDTPEQGTQDQGTQDQGTHDASTQDEEDDVNMFYQDMNNSIQAEDVEDMWDAADSEEHEMDSPGLLSRGRSMVSGIIPNMSSQLPGSPRLPSQLPKSSSLEPGLSSQESSPPRPFSHTSGPSPHVPVYSSQPPGPSSGVPVPELFRLPKTPVQSKTYSNATNVQNKASPRTPIHKRANVNKTPWPRSPFPDTPGLSRQAKRKETSSSPAQPHLQRLKKTVLYPPNLIESFKLKSAENSKNNVETGAVLAGFFNKEKSAWVISDLIFPKQTGTPTYYTETDGNTYGTYIIQKKMTQLGTIHTYPFRGMSKLLLLWCTLLVMKLLHSSP